jgi:cytidylate kinase
VRLAIVGNSGSGKSTLARWAAAAAGARSLDPGRHVLIVTYGCVLGGRAFAPMVSEEHRRIDSFPVGSLPQNLPAGYRRSIEAWAT